MQEQFRKLQGLSQYLLDIRLVVRYIVSLNCNETYGVLPKVLRISQFHRKGRENSHCSVVFGGESIHALEDELDSPTAVGT